MNHLVRIIVAAGLAVLSCYASAAGQTNVRELPEYSKPEVFTDYFPARLLLDAYKYLTADTTSVSNAGPRVSRFKGARYPYRGEGVMSLGCADFTPMHEGWWSSLGSGYGYTWDIDNPHFPRRIGRAMRRANDNYRLNNRKQIKEEKQRLVQYLHTLGTEEEQPLIFTDIRRDYGGDIERYVDDLYNRSILIKRKHLSRFCRHPRVKTFVSDPGVRFVISMELYRNAQKLKAMRAERGSGE